MLQPGSFTQFLYVVKDVKYFYFLIIASIFIFGLKTTVDGVSYTRKVTVQVLECPVEHCAQCNADSPDECEECDEGYRTYASKGECIQTGISDEVQSAQAVVIGAIAVGIGASFTTSLITIASLQAIWGMINMFQIFILLPAFKVYIPSDIFKFVEGIDFLLINYNFDQLKYVPVYKQIYESLDYPQNDEYLSEIGFTSGSTLINNLYLFALIPWIMLIHLMLYYLRTSAKDPFIDSLYLKTIRVLFKVLTYAFYIRFFIEAFLFLMFGIFHELSLFDFTEPRRSTSFSLTLIVLLAIGFIHYIFFWQWLKSYQKERWIKQVYFTELFSGIKDSFLSRFYTLSFLFKRLCLCLWCTFLVNTLIPLKIGLFVLAQLMVLIYIIRALPFMEIKLNITEIINEVCLWLIISGLLYFNKKSRWNESVKWVCKNFNKDFSKNNRKYL